MKNNPLRMPAFALLLCLCTLAPAQPASQSLYNSLEKLSRSLVLINGSYVDTVSNKKLVDNAINAFVTTLDPHSAYIPAEQVEEVNEALDGSFEGVGIEFAIINDTLTIQNVISGGPSEAVGLNIGDKLLSVNGEDIAGVSITNDGVRKRLRGPKGSTVMMTVLRPGVKGLLEFKVVRDKIPLTSVDAAYLTDGNIFYFKLGRFAAQSMQEFEKAYNECCAAGEPDGMILDLRGNGGGFLTTALLLANTFLEEGQTILYTEGRHMRPQYERANGRGFYKKKPLVILVDENSASASEIVSGAMQDWDRAVIIGRRTFGKGLVQRQYTLGDGSQLRLTVARYHTPSGRVIQTPYREGERDEYYHKMIDRWNSGEFFNADSLKFPDSLRFETAIQHRPVYGGGGITPDIFIPGDTTAVTSYLSSLIRQGILQEFVNVWCDAHRKELKSKCDDFDTFLTYYNNKLNDSVFDELVEYACKRGLERNEEQIATSRALLQTRLKGLIARSMFSMTEYYRVCNSECDPEFEKAVEVITHWPSSLPSLFR